MKRISYTIISILAVFCFNVKGQTDLPSNLVLNDILANGSYNYQASQSIALRSGFNYQAIGNNLLTASIDPLNLQTSLYPNNVLGGVNNGIVGKIKDNFEISSFGQVSYQIPITIPTGTGGISPQLSISYTGSPKNGLIGVGFDLGGLSIVNRAPSNLQTDGQVGKVNFSTTDKFMIDGQRLIYLRDIDNETREYRTEYNSFSKIIAKGKDAANPDRFLCYTKNGLINEYGSNYSQLKSATNGDNTLFWLLRKVSDTKGNFYIVNYDKDNEEYWPIGIEYTGNDNTGLATYASVRFTYKDSPYPDFYYINGMKIRSSKILNEIGIYSGKNKIKYYGFTYNTSYYKYRLQQVTEYASDGTKLNPTHFTWNAINNYVNRHTISGISDLNEKADIYLGDFNGDGKSDILAVYEVKPTNKWEQLHYKYNIYLSTGSSFVKASSDKFSNGEIKQVIVADFSGNGISDIVIVRKYDSKYISELYRASTSSHNPEIVTLLAYYNNKFNLSEFAQYFFQTGDFNGDGISDLLQCYIYEKSSAGNLYLGSNDSPLYNKFQFHFPKFWYEIHIADFDGDGKSDILNIDDKGFTICGFNTDGNTIKSIENIKMEGTFINKNNYVHLGDFNGDGKIDMLVSGQKGKNWNYWLMYFSTGVGFEKKTIKQYFNPDDREIFIADVNNDGKDDFYTHMRKSSINTASVFSTYVNNGDWNSNPFTACINNSGYPLTRGLDKCLSYYGDFNGDGKTDYICTNNWRKNSDWKALPQLYLHPGGNNLLAQIKDGLGNLTNIDYKPMTDKSIHTKGTTFSYPLVSYTSAQNLVSKVEIFHGNGISRVGMVEYEYGNALLHKKGRGFLGFEYVTTKDRVQGIETISQYEIHPKYYFMALKQVEKYCRGEDLISKIEFTNTLYAYNVNYTGSQKIFTYDPTDINEYTYDLYSYKLYSTISKKYSYDGYGNITQLIEKIGDTDVITNINTYVNDESKWHLGRLRKAVVIKRKGKDETSRTSEFEYDAESGLLTKEMVESKNIILGYSKAYQHDAYGNIVQSTTTPNNKKDIRILKSKYDSWGRFEIESINNLGFSTKREVDSDLGLILSETDPNGIKTEFIYDSFGQLIFTKNPLGNTQTVTRWSKSHPDSPTDAVYFLYSEASGTPPVIDFFDGLGRSLRKITMGFSDDQKIYTDVIYNTKGQIEKYTEPYFAGQTAYWNKYKYDDLGRRIKEIYPDNTYSQFQYINFVSTSISPLGHKDLKETDALGRIIKSTDNKGGIVIYEYDVAGNCTKVVGPRTEILTEYDIVGNRTKLIDPDLGTIEYEYNAYGELVSVKDSHGIKSFIYDGLGRLIQEKNPDGITTYTHDSQKKGLLDKAQLDKNGISKSLKYDSYGRIISTTETIDGKTFISQTTYDVYGRVDKITYPSGFEIVHEYNKNGYLTKVRSPKENKIYWNAKVMNARGQLEQITLGNNLTTTVKYNSEKGYITDIITPNIQNWSYKVNSVGNLTDRIDNSRNRTEHFDYDELNRLWKVSHNGQLNQEILYDTAGNITSKTGVGSKFIYKKGTNQLEYVSGGQYTPPNWDVIEYTSFDKISNVIQGNDRLTLVYGTSKERKKSITVQNETTATKYYIGSLYEEEHLSGEEQKKIHYIFANGGVIAIYEQSNKNSDKLCYLHKDHLGSIQAYSDEAGKLVSELSYDAWGRRRNPINWQYYTNLTDAKAWHPRGFTGHEHMDIFEMINMNGRMYDPILGRFLSPDPFVQAPDYTQGLNRYAYCMNNPLSLVDPSGYSWFGKNWKSIVVVTVGVAVTIVTMGTGASLAAVVGAGVLGGLASGITGALLNGANSEQIFKSAYEGAIWGGVSAAASFGAGSIGKAGLWAKLAAHSSSQAIISGVQGGSMKHGFISGLASSAGGVAISKYGGDWSRFGKVAANATISGTATELGGGKFANGAITGAYAMLFNDLLHEQKEDKALRKYVEAMFPGRIPDGVNVKFMFHDEDYGLTSSYILPRPKNILVYIPKQYWESTDNRLLIDCIDHELVHVDDYASGRAYNYFMTYDRNQETMNYIMEYKAFSQNQWHNINMRQENGRFDYSDKIMHYKSKLPKEWWNIK